MIVYCRKLEDIDGSKDKNDDDAVNIVKSEFTRYGLDKVTVEEYDVVVTYPDPNHPNVLMIINQNGLVDLNVTFNKTQRPLGASTGNRSKRMTVGPSADVGNALYRRTTGHPPYVVQSQAGDVQVSYKVPIKHQQ